MSNATQVEKALSRDVRRRLLGMPHVTDVVVGFKAVGGRLTDQLAIVAYVDAKLPMAELAVTDLVPRTIGGVPTDVELDVDARFVRPNPANAADRTRVRPLTSGISIGISASHAGTLGLFARRKSDGKAVLVSNYHVLYRGRGLLDITGEPHEVFQPPIGSENRIGEVVEGRIGGELDAAFATLDDEAAVCCCKSVIPYENRAGTTSLTGVATARVGDVITKTGRKTGLTVGKVVSVKKKITGAVDYTSFDLPAGSSFSFENLIMIVKWDEALGDYKPDEPFTEEGDSGSALVNASGEVIGLHFMSYFSSAQNRHYSFGCHIETVEDKLGVTVPGSRTGLAASGSTGAGDALTASLDDTIDTGSGTVMIGGALFAARSVHATWIALEERLRASESGRAWMALFERHRFEILRLVNHRRSVTVAWHRSEGPAWFAALVRSATRSGFVLPRDILGTTREALAARMGQVLAEAGSPELQRDLADHGSLLRRLVSRSRSTAKLVDLLCEVSTTAINPVTAND